MALAKQMNTLAAAHPALNFLGGLTVGIVLAVAATVLVLSLQSEDSAEARSFTPATASDELAAPRVPVGEAASAWSRSEDEALAAARIAGPQTYGFARVASEDEALAAPRVVSGPAPSAVEAPRRVWSSDQEAMAAERVLVR